MSLMYACKRNLFFFFSTENCYYQWWWSKEKPSLIWNYSQFIWGKDIWKKWRKWRQSRKPCPFAWNSSFPEPHWKRFSLYIIFIVLFAFNLHFPYPEIIYFLLCLSISSYLEFLLWSFYNTLTCTFTMKHFSCTFALLVFHFFCVCDAHLPGEVNTSFMVEFLL